MQDLYCYYWAIRHKLVCCILFHIFSKAQFTSDKNVHNFWCHSLPQFFKHSVIVNLMLSRGFRNTLNVYYCYKLSSASEQNWSQWKDTGKTLLLNRVRNCEHYCSRPFVPIDWCANARKAQAKLIKFCPLLFMWK